MAVDIHQIAYSPRLQSYKYTSGLVANVCCISQIYVWAGGERMLYISNLSPFHSGAAVLYQTYTSSSRKREIVCMYEKGISRWKFRVELFIHLLNLTRSSCKKCNYRPSAPLHDRNRTCGSSIPVQHSNQLSYRETVVEL